MMPAVAAPARTCLDFEQVRQLLPHRFPFLMLDRVTHLEPGCRIVAIKNVTGNELHFLGHFPQAAVMPGAFIIEAAAQAAMLLSAAGAGDATQEAATGYLASARMSFHTPVTPGDQLLIEVALVRRLRSMYVARAKITSGGAVVARGELILRKG